VRVTSAAFKTEKAKRANAPVFLYVVEDYDGQGSILRLAEHDTDVVFDGETYIKFPVTHEFTGDNAEGQIEVVKVRVGNVNRLLQAYLEQWDLRGKKVTIRLVWASRLDDPESVLDEIFWIDSVTASEETVEFSLSGKFDVLGLEVPARKYSRNYCGWRFKSPQCGYQGGMTTCNKTKADCQARGNYKRFGAFPSVPTKRIYVM